MPAPANRPSRPSAVASAGMHFDDTPEEAAFRAEVRDWLKASLPRRPSRNEPPLPWTSRGGAEDLSGAKKVQGALAAAGLAGLTWPSAFGGREAPASFQLIFDDEAAAYEVPTTIFIVGVGLAGPTLILHGTDAQRRRYLGPILSGEEVWCQLFSEPEAGSDLASLRTRAIRDGSDWVVTGQKVWSSGAHYADLAILLARTDPRQSKHRGITFFVLEMQTPGITVRPLRQMTGGAHFAEVFLDDVRVPAENVVGEVNSGWEVIQTTLANERLSAAGTDFAVDPTPLILLARDVVRNGSRGSTDPTTRQALADIYIRARVLDFVRYRLRTALSQGRIPGSEVSIAKLANAQLLKLSADLGLQLQGARGMLAGDHAGAVNAGTWQQVFLSAPALRIGGGTDEIQRNIIGERILGLPREPGPSRTQLSSHPEGTVGRNGHRDGLVAQ